MAKQYKRLLFAACILIALAQGAILLKVPSNSAWVIALLYAGIVGSIPFLLLNGVHGDAEGVAGIVGGLLYALTNGAVYYGLFRSFSRLAQRWHRR